MLLNQAILINSCNPWLLLVQVTNYVMPLRIRIIVKVLIQKLHINKQSCWVICSFFHNCLMCNSYYIIIITQKGFCQCPHMYVNTDVCVCVCCRGSDCSVRGVPAYPEQHPAPWESPAALSGAETAERAKDKGVGCRLEPLIIYSFHPLQEPPPSPLYLSLHLQYVPWCTLGLRGKYG